MLVPATESGSRPRPPSQPLGNCGTLWSQKSVRTTQSLGLSMGTTAAHLGWEPQTVPPGSANPSLGGAGGSGVCGAPVPWTPPPPFMMPQAQMTHLPVHLTAAEHSVAEPSQGCSGTAACDCTPAGVWEWAQGPKLSPSAAQEQQGASTCTQQCKYAHIHTDRHPHPCRSVHMQTHKIVGVTSLHPIQ